MSFKQSLQQLNDKMEQWIFNFRRTWKPRLAEWKLKREKLRKEYGYDKEDTDYSLFGQPSKKKEKKEHYQYTDDEDNEYIVLKKVVKPEKKKKKPSNLYKFDYI